MDSVNFFDPCGKYPKIGLFSNILCVFCIIFCALFIFLIIFIKITKTVYDTMTFNTYETYNVLTTPSTALKIGKMGE